MTAGVLLSVFAMALMGGVHCAAMCGGIALVAEPGRGAQAQVQVWRRPGDWLLALCAMHAGRISTYALLGAALGGLGAPVWKTDAMPVQRLLFGAGSAMLVLSGLWLLRGRPFGAGWAGQLAARAAAVFGALGAPGLVAARRRRADGAPVAGATVVSPRRSAGRALPRRYATGLAWGLVPCGMVYSALTLALLAGNAASGALVMAVFGLGTLPNLIVLSGLSGYLRQLSRRRAVRIAAGLAVMGFGAAGLFRAITLPQRLAEHGFCMVF